MNYRVCSNCGAALDPGERCDCQEKERAAPDASNNESGKVDPELTRPRSASIVQKN